MRPRGALFAVFVFVESYQLTSHFLYLDALFGATILHTRVFNSNPPSPQVLTTDSDEFWTDTTPLQLGGIPELQVCRPAQRISPAVLALARSPALSPGMENAVCDRTVKRGNRGAERPFWRSS